MKRRSFLAMLGFAPVAAAVPAVAEVTQTPKRSAGFFFKADADSYLVAGTVKMPNGQTVHSNGLNPFVYENGSWRMNVANIGETTSGVIRPRDGFGVLTTA